MGDTKEIVYILQTYSRLHDSEILVKVVLDHIEINSNLFNYHLFGIHVLNNSPGHKQYLMCCNSTL